MSSPAGRPDVPGSSSSSSSSSGGTSWRSVAAATAIIGTIALGLSYLKIRARRTATILDSTNDMPPLEPVPSNTATKKKKSTKSNVSRNWSENEFGTAATQFLDTLGNHNVVDPDREEELRAALPKVINFSNEARALAAHFLLATNAHYLTESASEREFDQLMAKQAIDMRQAWELLECADSTPDQGRALDVMRIQVAQCLKDATLMVPIFDRMTARPVQEFVDEELILLFTTAPLLGRWQKTVELGDRLSTMHDLSDFHGAPMDYQILYQLAKTEQAKGNVPIQQLQWKNYKICMQRIKLRTSACSDSAILQSLEQEFSQDGERTWKILPVHDQLRLVRCGALSQLRSFSPVPLALVGPSSDTRIYAQGYAEIGESPAQSKQTETYELIRVQLNELEGGQSGEGADADLPADAMHWKGSYVMVQEPAEDSQQAQRLEMATLRVTFDFEMSIVPLSH